MIYAVNEHIDQVKPKEKREFYIDGKTPKALYFATKTLAHEFINNRAHAEVLKAENNLRLAIARQRKCQRKFPIFILGDDK